MWRENFVRRLISGVIAKVQRYDYYWYWNFVSIRMEWKKKKIGRREGIKVINKARRIDNPGTITLSTAWLSTDCRLSECFECSSFSNDPEDRYPKRKRVTHPSSFLELTRRGRMRVRIWRKRACKLVFRGQRPLAISWDWVTCKLE